MPDTIHQIPIAVIEDDALTRDRTGLDAEPMMELRTSIAAHGLRCPIEVFPMERPHGERTYGLLSGFRRINAYRALLELTKQERYTTIAAIVRERTDLASSLTAMVEENEIRADISPFERGLIAVRARNQGAFGSIEEAIDGLYPEATSQKRSRLRTLARVAEEVDGLMTAPERLSENQLLRLAGAFRAGFGDVIAAAINESSLTDPETQWALLLPILGEAERDPAAIAGGGGGAVRSGRPRRVLTLRRGLTIRREMARDGYILRFTGREASSPLMDRVMDEIEMIFTPRQV